VNMFGGLTGDERMACIEAWSLGSWGDRLGELVRICAAVEARCIGRDPLCPCQDGDACHYRDTPTTKAWPVPEKR